MAATSLVLVEGPVSGGLSFHPITACQLFKFLFLYLYFPLLLLLLLQYYYLVAIPIYRLATLTLVWISLLGPAVQHMVDLVCTRSAVLLKVLLESGCSYGCGCVVMGKVISFSLPSPFYL